jgi:hypothetical protein
MPQQQVLDRLLQQRYMLADKGDCVGCGVNHVLQS